MAFPRNIPSSSSVSGSAKFFYGFVVPVPLFIILQLVLLTVTDGNGGFEGMGIVLIGVVGTLALFVLNSWVVFTCWRQKQTLLLGGLLLPSVIGLVESLWTIGPFPIRQLINATIVAPFLWIWLFVGLLSLPLIASLVHALRRRSV